VKIHFTVHKIAIPQFLLERYVGRRGKAHAFDRLEPARTAHLVVDMQNAFLAPGEAIEIAMARDIVPGINRMSAALRAAGGLVVYLQNTVDETSSRTWSNYLQVFLGPERGAKFAAAFASGGRGHALWPELEILPADLKVPKRRFSAFVEGSSELHSILAGRGIDTVIISGTSTNVCCESTACDASMMNYKVVFLSDATATYTDAEHNASLGNLLMFADVMTVDEAVSRLRA
jgi:ureidoacrylate peracid hydrolase